MEWLPLRRVDLNLLPVLETLLRTRSTTQTATLLAKTQPGVSRDLAKLRRIFGDPLFVRVGGRLEPTAQALALWPILKRALEDTALTLAKGTRFEPSTAQDSFQIGTNSSIELTLSTWMAHEFGTAAPSVSVRFSAVRGATVPEDELESGKMHVAVGRFETCSSACLVKPLITDQRVCIMRQGHPALKKPLTLDALTNLKFITTSAMQGVPNDVDRWLDSLGRSRKLPMFVSHLALAPYILMESDYVTTLPRKAAKLVASHFPLAIVELPHKIPQNTYSMIWAKRWDSVRPLIWLREQIEKAMDAA